MKSLFIFMLFVATPSFADDSRIVSVRGEGEIKAKPDLARIELQVKSQGKDAKTAQDKNSVEMARVQKVLKNDFSISAKDMQTSGYQLNPNYRYENNGKQIFLGFQVIHSLSITCKDLERVGALLDKVVSKGSEDLAVNVSNINFDSEKRKDFEIQALEVAMKSAQARAEALARFSKRSLKGVRRISDSSVSYQPYHPPGMMAMRGEAKMDAGLAAPISAGEISVQSNVSVDYDID